MQVANYSSFLRLHCGYILEFGPRVGHWEAPKGSSIIVIIYSVHRVSWGGGSQGRLYAFLNVVYSDEMK